MLKIQIDQKKLYKALNIANSIENKNDKHKSVHIKSINKDLIQITAFNDISMIEQTICCFVISNGSISVELVTLLNITKNLPNQQIIIESDKNTVRIKSVADFKISTFASEQIHTTPDDQVISSFYLETNTLLKLIRCTKFCINAGETRQNLNCMAVALKNNADNTNSMITSYGIDGHRLAKFQTQIDCVQKSKTEDQAQIDDINSIKNFDESDSKDVKESLTKIQNLQPHEFESLLPLKLVDQVINITNNFETVKIKLSLLTRSIKFLFYSTSQEEIKLTSSLANLDFLHYEKLMPKLDTYSLYFEISSNDMHMSISRVSAISSEKLKYVIMELHNDYLKLICHNENGSFSSEKLMYELNWLSKIEQISTDEKTNRNKEILDTHHKSSRYSDEHQASLDKEIYHHLNCTSDENDSNQQAQDNLYSDRDQADHSLDNSNVIFKIGINYRYLLDIMDLFKGSKIKIYIKDELSSIIVLINEEPGARFVIMPIRI